MQNCKLKNILSTRESIRVLGLLLCSLGFGGCTASFLIVEPAHAQNAARPSQAASINNSHKIFDVDTDYGTLAFKGIIERTDTGSAYKFHVQMAVIFLPGEIDAKGYTMTNRTKVADLKTCEMVATLKVEDNKPYQMLYRESQPIAVRLTEYAQVGTLPVIDFNVPKAIAERASHVGLAVIGSGLAWPIPVELK